MIGEGEEGTGEGEGGRVRGGGVDDGLIHF